MFSFLSLTMLRERGEGAEKHAFFIDTQKKNILIIKRQKAREKRSTTQQNYSTFHIFSTISCWKAYYPHNCHCQYREGIIDFKQRTLYIRKSTINVCWKNNYRMKIETLLLWIEKGEEYKRNRKSVKESWDKPHRQSR